MSRYFPFLRVVLLFTLPLASIAGEKTQDWYLYKKKYEFHLTEEALISSICLVENSKCLAVKSLENANSVNLVGRLLEGGKNPAHMICLISGGIPKQLRKGDLRKGFCIFKDGSAILLKDLYQASCDD